MMSSRSPDWFIQKVGHRFVNDVLRMHSTFPVSRGQCYQHNWFPPYIRWEIDIQQKENIMKNSYPECKWSACLWEKVLWTFSMRQMQMYSVYRKASCRKDRSIWICRAITSTGTMLRKRIFRHSHVYKRRADLCFLWPWH